MDKEKYEYSITYYCKGIVGYVISRTMFIYVFIFLYYNVQEKR